MQKLSRQITVLFTVDILIFLLVFLLVFWVRPETIEFEFVVSSVFVIISCLYVMYLKGFYDILCYRAFWNTAYNLFEALLIGITIPIVISFFLKPIFLPRFTIIIVAVLVYCLLLLWRTGFRNYIHSIKKHKKVIIVGAGHSGTTMAKEISAHPSLNFDIIGYVDDDPEKIGTEIEGFKVLGSCRNLPELVQETNLNVIILAITGKPKTNETLSAVAECMKLKVKFFDMPQLYSYITGKIPIRHITNSWFIYELGTSEKPLYNHLKRLLDIWGAIIISIVTSPIMLFLAVSIKFQDGGPVFYRQERVGKNNKIFKMLKFRTMVMNAEANGAVWAQNNDKDPRVTTIGRIARKLRFDELPQMYNILVGEMSLVGPRPERPEFTCELERKIPFYDRRHWVMPGWTGWAQIMFKYGASIDDASEKLQYDFYYIKNRSIFLDMSILLKAIAMAVSGRHG
jgi:exopolysaccharide biosynthesis polyprenyl glycosylphosphotransferase